MNKIFNFMIKQTSKSVSFPNKQRHNNSYDNIYGKSNQAGFTLIELLIALSIYLVLVSTLVIVSQNASNTLSDLEKRAIAQRALKNIVIDFKLKPISYGRKIGQYQMSHFNYDWEINVEKSQSASSKILTAKISISDKQNTKTNILAIQQEVIFK